MMVVAMGFRFPSGVHRFNFLVGGTIRGQAPIALSPPLPSLLGACPLIPSILSQKRDIVQARHYSFKIDVYIIFAS
jgi:hypothetical protein